MIRRPPRSTLKLCRRQRQMCIRDSAKKMNFFIKRQNQWKKYYSNVNE
nr:hypothetical protein [Pedobacter sp. ASV2]